VIAGIRRPRWPIDLSTSDTILSIIMFKLQLPLRVLINTAERGGHRNIREAIEGSLETRAANSIPSNIETIEIEILVA
jgi:hypothetical protein